LETTPPTTGLGRRKSRTQKKKMVDNIPNRNPPIEKFTMEDIVQQSSKKRLLWNGFFEDGGQIHKIDR